MYKFSLTPEQVKTLNEWDREQNAAAVLAQKKNPPDVPLALLESCWEDGYPYSGASGGVHTYSFTPTSLGVVASVRHAHTLETLDLTDWDDW